MRAQPCARAGRDTRRRPGADVPTRPLKAALSRLAYAARRKQRASCQDVALLSKHLKQHDGNHCDSEQAALAKPTSEQPEKSEKQFEEYDDESEDYEVYDAEESEELSKGDKYKYIVVQVPPCQLPPYLPGVAFECDGYDFGCYGYDDGYDGYDHHLIIPPVGSTQHREQYHEQYHVSSEEADTPGENAVRAAAERRDYQEAPLEEYPLEVEETEDGEHEEQESHVDDQDYEEQLHAGSADSQQYDEQENDISTVDSHGFAYPSGPATAAYPAPPAVGPACAGLLAAGVEGTVARALPAAARASGELLATGAHRPETAQAPPGGPGEAGTAPPPAPDGGVEGALPAAGHLREGLRARLVGLQAKPELNGKEGVLGPFDPESGRWALRLGQAALRVKAESLEVIGKLPRCRLEAAFLEKAAEFQYHDVVRNKFVFDRLYGLGSAEGKPGVAAMFEQLLASEPLFDATYGRMES